MAKHCLSSVLLHTLKRLLKPFPFQDLDHYPLSNIFGLIWIILQLLINSPLWFIGFYLWLETNVFFSQSIVCNQFFMTCSLALECFNYGTIILLAMALNCHLYYLVLGLHSSKLVPHALWALHNTSNCYHRFALNLSIALVIKLLSLLGFMEGGDIMDRGKLWQNLSSVLFSYFEAIVGNQFHFKFLIIFLHPICLV